MDILRDLFAALIALIHVYIFALESLLWMKPKTARIFGMTAEQAAANRQMAFNQGFYNLFLAIEIVFGFVLLAKGVEAGRWLVDFGALSVLGAGLVLILGGGRRMLRGAMIQVGPAAGYLLLRLFMI